MSEWQPIETAPKDGRPVWVRGNDWGEDAGPNHYGWAYFDSGKWMWPAPVAEGGEATYLTHWLPTQESTYALAQGRDACGASLAAMGCAADGEK